MSFRFNGLTSSTYHLMMKIVIGITTCLILLGKRHMQQGVIFMELKVIMKVGDLVIRNCSPQDCDSGPSPRDFGIVIEITPSKSVFIFWSVEGFTIGYSNSPWELSRLKVISESG